MLLQNIDQIEKAQDSLIRKSRRGRTFSIGLEAAAEMGRVEDIVRAAKNIDKGFVEMSDQINEYDEVKRACQNKREEFVSHVDRGTDELCLEIENQIDMLSEILDIARYKSVKITQTEEDE